MHRTKTSFVLLFAICQNIDLFYKIYTELKKKVKINHLLVFSFNYRNEQEFLLLEEKHREEMELCKIRLGNATKIIAQLEQELSVYRAKRYEK